jgi:hypothetical protein
MDPLPTSTSQPGWPEYLTDANGDFFVRLRDGVPTSEWSGHGCLYGFVDPNSNMILRDHLYGPTLGATAEECHMSGGSWMEPEAMVAAGIPPIAIPPEPINFLARHDNRPDNR